VLLLHGVSGRLSAYGNRNYVSKLWNKSLWL
jgi:hypothetical protein